jgi:hypothetical protein
MNPALAPFVVEGLLIIVAAVFGFLVGKKGKPYGIVKLVVPLFFIHDDPIVRWPIKFRIRSILPLTKIRTKLGYRPAVSSYYSAMADGIL